MDDDVGRHIHAALVRILPDHDRILRREFVRAERGRLLRHAQIERALALFRRVRRIGRRRLRARRRAGLRCAIAIQRLIATRAGDGITAEREEAGAQEEIALKQRAVRVVHLGIHTRQKERIKLTAGQHVVNRLGVLNRFRRADHRIKVAAFGKHRDQGVAHVRFDRLIERVIVGVGHHHRGVVGGNDDGAAVRGLIGVIGEAADTELLAVAEIDLHRGIARRGRQHDRARRLEAVRIKGDLPVAVDGRPRRQAVLRQRRRGRERTQDDQQYQGFAHYLASFGWA